MKLLMDMLFSTYRVGSQCSLEFKKLVDECHPHKMPGQVTTCCSYLNSLVSISGDPNLTTSKLNLYIRVTVPIASIHTLIKLVLNRCKKSAQLLQPYHQGVFISFWYLPGQSEQRHISE
ncbi:hypothetical protein RF11_15792 [Thelohanellus kitauei]|uniref:Uncharacterized protein n=1 Tax=Thelohanellus kitauei TaxID=669202 RepID=A0A0C2MNN4_THEKT|nr:hypothetical protein RF11_15792 [Thelohanellus kitauei]